MSSEKTGLAKIEVGAIRLSELVSQPCASLYDDGTRDNSYLLGFDPKDKAGESLLFAMESDANGDPADYRDKPFDMIAWGCKRVPLYDDTAREMVSVIRTVLFGADGTMLAFVSDGVVASLDLIRALKGDGPWNPPLQIVIREVKTRRGYRLYKLQPFGILNVPAARPRK